jgi:hypothetical protein
MENLLKWQRRRKLCGEESSAEKKRSVLAGFTV